VTAGREILFSEAEIAARVETLARDLIALSVDVAAPVLAGGFVFAADLMRALARHGRSPATEFLWLRSYDGRGARGTEVIVGPSAKVRGKKVLIIDGVLDRGTTIAKARALLREAGAASVVSAVAVDKLAEGAAAHADFALFQGVSGFIVGYGMDEDGRDRGLPYIACAD
jgi:hypoxanthine phosphoribosyltransferase